jgi:hypothetical protein
MSNLHCTYKFKNNLVEELFTYEAITVQKPVTIYACESRLVFAYSFTAMPLVIAMQSLKF